MIRGTLVVRADASIVSGTGHVMRCLALGQAWQHAGGEVIFAMAQSTSAVRQRLRSQKIGIFDIRATPGTIEDVRQTNELSLSCHPEWLVVDGYHFTTSYVLELQNNGHSLLLIDDNGELESYSARFVLNQNLNAAPEMYAKRTAQTKLLLGPSYALLRDEFTVYRDWNRNITSLGTRVLVTMGGSDPEDLAPGVLSALLKLAIDELHLRVVVGGSADNGSRVGKAAEKFPGRVEVLSDVANMAELMAWADLAIAGAGTTCWEMCLLGLPAILVVVAENQRFIADRLSAIGAAVNAGRSEALDCPYLAQTASQLLKNQERRVEMSRAGRQLVDGCGRERVCAALFGRELNLRLLRESDCMLLFNWASDPATRAASFHSGAILWENHTRWFDERSKDPQTIIYIGENSSNQPVGLVRFQMSAESAVLSVNVAPEFRGQGWGKELVSISTRSLVRTHEIRCVDAFVKPENQASVGLFEACGFSLLGKEKIAGQDALMFHWECVDGAQLR